MPLLYLGEGEQVYPIPKVANTREPMISDVGSIVYFPFGRPPPVDHKILYTYFFNSPEVVAIIKAIVEDILSDGGRFEGGRNNVKRAESFWRKNRMKEQLTSFLTDVLVTGDGFFYKCKVDPDEVKNLIYSVVARLPSDYEIKADDLIYSLKAEAENIYQTSDIRFVPSSTMRIQYNIHGKITSFIQRVGIKIAVFRPDEILQWSPWKVNGEVYGFSPLRAILRELDMLSSIKDYENFFFQKGGVPNQIFILKNETPESPTYKNFIRQLQTFALVVNKWKSMVLTGDVEIQPLQNFEKDMEFQELSRFVTQVIVMAWGVPSSRLSDMLITKGLRASQVSTDGYYRMISHYQDMLEDLLNEELFGEFGVEWRFNRTYKQDELREAQTKMSNADTLMKQQSILQQYGLRMSKDEILRTLEFRDEDVEEAPAPDPTQYPNNRQTLKPNSQTMAPNSEAVAQNADKQDAAMESDQTQKSFRIDEIPLDEQEVVNMQMANRVTGTPDIDKSVKGNPKGDNANLKKGLPDQTIEIYNKRNAEKITNSGPVSVAKPEIIEG